MLLSPPPNSCQAFGTAITFIVEEEKAKPHQSQDCVSRLCSSRVTDTQGREYAKAFYGTGGGDLN